MSETYAENVSHLDIGMYKDFAANMYKDLVRGNFLKIWVFYYKTDEACPYANRKVILVSSFQEGKNVGYVRFSYFQNWSDAPFFDNCKTSSV